MKRKDKVRELAFMASCADISDADMKKALASHGYKVNLRNCWHENTLTMQAPNGWLVIIEV